jgi:transcriptional regulator with XRE-family HTH domain
MLDLQHTVGAVIRRERRERGLTLKALAERSALSVVYLGEIERGKKYPSAQVLEQLAKALALDLAELLELVADELRGVALPGATSATGITLPREGDTAPRATVRRLVQMLEPHEAATMAELGAFFLARRSGKTEAE